MESESPILDLEEVSRLLKLSRRTLSRLLSLGKLKGFRHTPKGKIYFYRSEVNSYLASLQQQQPTKE